MTMECSSGMLMHVLGMNPKPELPNDLSLSRISTRRFLT